MFSHSSKLYPNDSSSPNLSHFSKFSYGWIVEKLHWKFALKKDKNLDHGSFQRIMSLLTAGSISSYLTYVFMTHPWRYPVTLKLQMLNGAGFVGRHECNNTNTSDNHSWLDLKTVCRTHSTLAHLFTFCHDFKGNKWSENVE